MKIILFSNSGTPLYQWCKDKIAEVVGNREVTFISAATVYDPNDYFEEAKAALSNIKLNHLVLEENPQDLISKSEVFLVAGGNTYHLARELKKYKLLERLEERVADGALYIGLSAGANVAGPNILTTNDWNVLGSTDFEGLNLVPFNINPHYINPHDKSVFSGESRDDRIARYLEFHDNPVVAIEEQTYLEIENGKIGVSGKGKAKVFIKGKEAKEFKSGTSIKF